MSLIVNKRNVTFRASFLLRGWGCFRSSPVAPVFCFITSACLLYCLIRNGAEGQSYSADVKKVHLDGMRFSLLFEKQVNRLA